jgi:arabinogalactan oligomer/maltooligosaccharide transport system permease protein
LIKQPTSQMQSTVAQPATPARVGTRPRGNFFRATRGDSPFKRILIHLVLIGYCIITLYPISRVISVSLRPNNQLLSGDLSPIPQNASFDSYRTVLTQRPFWEWMFNSLIITITVMVIGVVLAATAAYAFSRFKFVGRGSGMVFLLANQMIPATMLILPIFLMLSRLGLTHTYSGIIFAYSVSAVPFSVWILKGYYDTIPRDLEEAAMVDGATPLGAFWRVIVPLSTPALAIAALFNFTQAWNEYLLASLIFTYNDPVTNQQITTWPVGLNTMLGQFNSEWGNFAAASVMVAIPVMALFLYSSKWLIGGLTLGGVKG